MSKNKKKKKDLRDVQKQAVMQGQLRTAEILTKNPKVLPEHPSH